jgi:hypothetical protein
VYLKSDMHLPPHHSMAIPRVLADTGEHVAQFFERLYAKVDPHHYEPKPEALLWVMLSGDRFVLGSRAATE